MHIVDFEHPVTQGLPQDLFWGTNAILGPVFHLEEPEARVLGQVVYSEGRCMPGMGVREFEDWTSVFGSERLTGALLDRLTHHVHILEMNGDSYRLKQSKARRSR